MWGFNLATKSLNKLLEFCKRHKMAEDFFITRVMVHTLIKNPISPVQSTNQPCRKITKVKTYQKSRNMMLKINITINISLLVPSMALGRIYICSSFCSHRPNLRRRIVHPLVEEESVVNLQVPRSARLIENIWTL